MRICVVTLAVLRSTSALCQDTVSSAMCLKVKQLNGCDQYGKTCAKTCGKCVQEVCSAQDAYRLGCEQKCTVENGNPTCGCYPGFKAKPEGKCADLNECSEGSGKAICAAKDMNCNNYVGGYYCDEDALCPVGKSKFYRRNGCCKYDSGEKCGRPFQFFGRIYNGHDAKRKQWPWIVHIQVSLKSLKGTVSQNFYASYHILKERKMVHRLPRVGGNV